MTEGILPIRAATHDPTAGSAEYPIEVLRTASPVDRGARERLPESSGFGKVFTDPMATATWTRERGWHDARVSARRPFEIDPAACVLHYAQEIFEGLKAYRDDEG